MIRFIITMLILMNINKSAAEIKVGDIIVLDEYNQVIEIQKGEI